MDRKISKIVVGIADTERDEPHLPPTLLLARAVGSALEVVHAISTPGPVLAPIEPTVTSDPDWLANIRRELESRLKARITGLASDVATSYHIVQASPAQAIVEVAERERADLVVVGATRRGGVASVVLGTTAQRVLRASPAPLLVKRSPRSAPNRVLFTTDLSERSMRVFQVALDLLSTLWESSEVEFRALFVAGEGLPLPRSQVDQFAMQLEGEARLTAFLRRATPEGVQMEERVRLNPVAGEILSEADAWGADLLVTGTHGPTGLSRFLIGSVAETVARRATSDVLLIPAALTDPE